MQADTTRELFQRTNVGNNAGQSAFDDMTCEFIPISPISLKEQATRDLRDWTGFDPNFLAAPKVKSKTSCSSFSSAEDDSLGQCISENGYSSDPQSGENGHHESRQPSQGPATDELDQSPVSEHSNFAQYQQDETAVTGDSFMDTARGDYSVYDPLRVKHRRRTTAPQLKILETQFVNNPKPDVPVRKSLADQLGMTPREVQVWFQNRRAKVKRLDKRAASIPDLNPRRASMSAVSNSVHDSNHYMPYDRKPWHSSSAKPSYSTDYSNYGRRASDAYGTSWSGAPYVNKAAQSTALFPNVPTLPIQTNLFGNWDHSSARTSAPSASLSLDASSMSNLLPPQEHARSLPWTPSILPPLSVEGTAQYLHHRQPSSSDASSTSSYNTFSFGTASSADTSALATPTSMLNGGCYPDGYQTVEPSYPLGYNPNSRRSSCPTDFVNSFRQLGLPMQHSRMSVSGSLPNWSTTQSAPSVPTTASIGLKMLTSPNMRRNSLQSLPSVAPATLNLKVIDGYQRQGSLASLAPIAEGPTLHQPTPNTSQQAYFLKEEESETMPAIANTRTYVARRARSQASMQSPSHEYTSGKSH